MISFEKLWKLLKSRRITTYQLRNKYGLHNISSTSIYRMLNHESVSTNTLDSLCKILNCKIEDIVEFIPDETMAEVEKCPNSSKGQSPSP